MFGLSIGRLSGTFNHTDARSHGGVEMMMLMLLLGPVCVCVCVCVCVYVQV